MKHILWPFLVLVLLLALAFSTPLWAQSHPVFPLIDQPNITVSLVVGDSACYLVCVLALPGDERFEPIALLIANQPDTLPRYTCPLSEYVLQPKIGGVPDEAFIFTIPTAQLREVCEAPGELLLIVPGKIGKSLLIHIFPKIKDAIIHTFKWNDTGC